MKNISILLIISLILLGFALNSCDDDTEPYVDAEYLDCEYCFEEDPEYMDVKLIFNMDTTLDTVFFTVYSGFAFDSEIFIQDIATENEWWLEVKTNQNYTVVAEYKKCEDLILVVNDFYSKTEFYKNACDEPCYYVHEIHCNLELDF